MATIPYVTATGVGALIAGTAAPFLQIPVFGAYSMAQTVPAQAGVIVLVGLGLLVLAAVRWRTLQMLVGLATLALLGYWLSQFQQVAATYARTSLSQDLGAPFLQLGWGWALLFGGAALATVAGAFDKGAS